MNVEFDAKEELRIAHLSDLHLPLTQPVPAGSLFGKRALGWLNLKMLRSHTHRLDIFRALLGHVARRDPDAVVITGDLVNLAYDFEFAQVAGLLEEAGLDARRCLLVPGNHDRYTAGSDRRGAFEKGMRAWLPLDLQQAGGYPWRMELGRVCLLALDSAVWRGPLRAAGRLRAGQLERLARMLDELEPACHPVLAMHHPPIRLRGPVFRDYRAGLTGCRKLLGVLAGRRATVLHGHLHRLGRQRVGNLEIIGAPSASRACGRVEEQAACHWLRVTNAGVQEAKALRLWPDDEGGWRLEEAPLPGEALLR